MLPATWTLKSAPSCEQERVSTAAGAEVPPDAVTRATEHARMSRAARTNAKLAEPGTSGRRFATIDRMAMLEHPAESNRAKRPSDDLDEAELVRRAQLGSSA